MGGGRWEVGGRGERRWERGEGEGREERRGGRGEKKKKKKKKEEEMKPKRPWKLFNDIAFISNNSCIVLQVQLLEVKSVSIQMSGNLVLLDPLQLARPSWRGWCFIGFVLLILLCLLDSCALY